MQNKNPKIGGIIFTIIIFIFLAQTPAFPIVFFLVVWMVIGFLKNPEGMRNIAKSLELEKEFEELHKKTENFLQNTNNGSTKKRKKLLTKKESFDQKYLYKQKLRERKASYQKTSMSETEKIVAKKPEVATKNQQSITESFSNSETKSIWDDYESVIDIMEREKNS